jgi:hypothetical protein
MDENKAQALRDAGYRVRGCCSLCQNKNFPKPRADWGTCKVNLYDHKKHTGEPREASVHRTGWCPNFVMEEGAEAQFGKYSEFVEGATDPKALKPTEVRYTKGPAPCGMGY